jgi:hypothetical protein
MKKAPLVLLGLAAGSFLYAASLCANWETQTQRRLYVRSWMQVSQPYNNRLGKILSFVATGAIASTVGLTMLWQQTREDLPVDAMTVQELESAIASTDLDFPQAIPALTELEQDVLEFCLQRVDQSASIPASAVQQSKYKSTKGLGADAIREAFLSLTAKGYGSCEGEGRKLSFTASTQNEVQGQN